MAQFFLFIPLFVIYHNLILSGSISLPKLCPPHTKRPFVLLVLPLFVLEVGTAHIVHPVEETVTDIAVRRMKAHQENIGPNSLVSVGVLLGSSLALHLVVILRMQYYQNHASQLR